MSLSTLPFPPTPKTHADIRSHIHWYERMYPLGRNSTIVPSNYVNNNTYITGNGKSITYLVNGQAGNIESHSNFAANGDHRLNITAYLVRVPPPLFSLCHTNADGWYRI